MSILRRVVWGLVPNVGHECCKCRMVPRRVWRITLDVCWYYELDVVDAFMCEQCWDSGSVEERLLSQLPE